MVSPLRVAVLFGGRSCEHDVSCISAEFVMRQLDPRQFTLMPIFISKSGVWYEQNPKQLLAPNDGLLIHNQSKPLTIYPYQLEKLPFDVVFPVLHGRNGEDGRVQGFLALLDCPFVGANTLSSAIAMDKAVAKTLVAQAGIPVVPSQTIYAAKWRANYEEVLRTIEATMPNNALFVKPANAGSSVGITKVKQRSGLPRAIEDALQYDNKVLVEQAILARELEFAVLEAERWGDPAQVAVPGEVIPGEEYYSYTDKYNPNSTAQVIVPAVIGDDVTQCLAKHAADIFDILCCQGMARVDFFVDKQTSAYYFNELNTIPGFTQISVYPKAFERSRLPPRQLMTRLIKLAIRRHELKPRG